MKLWDIVKTVGTGMISTMVPGGPLIVGAINAVLPDDKQLPETATGQDAITAINSMPADQRAPLIEKQFDVDITQIQESHSTVRAMLESDAKNPHTTRPYIAKHAFHVVAFADVVSIGMWAYGIGSDNPEIVKAVTDGWPFVVAVLGPLTVLLLAYFGVLKVENKNRLDAANGSSNPSGIAGILSSILKR